MARIIQGLMSSPQGATGVDALTDLTRLVVRLQQTIMNADAERELRLRTSEYERRKATTNINIARSLLTKLEQEASTVKVLAKRQELQADLNRKRHVLDQLAEHVRDLDEMALTEGEEESSEGEDLLGDMVFTPSVSLDSSSPAAPPPEAAEATEAAESKPNSEEEDSVLEKLEPPKPSATVEPAVQERRHEGTVTSQTLRSRVKGPEKTDKAVSSARESLFASRKGTADMSMTATAEAILDHQRADQEMMFESLARMASDLKSSSQAFSASLEEDKDVVARAGDGLGKNEQGLDTASRRMGTLRRMTEGKGWWGRMLLYAWIYGLMVILILVVFVMPKLRFSTW